MHRTHLRSLSGHSLEKLRRPSVAALFTVGIGYLLASCAGDDGNSDPEGRTDNGYSTPIGAAGTSPQGSGGSANAGGNAGGGNLGGGANAGSGGRNNDTGGGL